MEWSSAVEEHRIKYPDVKYIRHCFQNFLFQNIYIQGMLYMHPELQSKNDILLWIVIKKFWKSLFLKQLDFEILFNHVSNNIWDDHQVNMKVPESHFIVSNRRNDKNNNDIP